MSQLGGVVNVKENVKESGDGRGESPKGLGIWAGATTEILHRENQ